MTRKEACAKMYAMAVSQLGIKEEEGPKANPQIVEYAKHTELQATSDEVPWCSAFANWVVDEAGFQGTRSAAARSWLKWGVRLEEAIIGCIVVLDRQDSSNPNAAHVAFCTKPDLGDGLIRCIGGNQSDQVKVSTYKSNRVLGYRSPV